MERFFVKDSQKTVLTDASALQLRSDRKLGFTSYKNATILPQSGVFLSGGVCAENGDYVKSTSFVEGLYDGSYPFSEEEVEVRHKYAVFLGSWFPVYGHAITDNISRLWFLFSEDFKKIKEEAESEGRELDLVYVYLKGNMDLAGYNRDIVSAAGINPDSLTRIGRIARYDNVYIPDCSLIPADESTRLFTGEFRFVVDKICINCRSDESLPEKVYLTRTGINDGKDFGEKALERIFEQRGYQVVSPESLSFSKQVALMQHCKSVVATEGSVAHNALFCNDGTELIILRKTDAFNQYTSLINSVRNLDYKYIEANHTRISRVPWGGHFFLWRTKYLNKYLGCGFSEKSRWCSLLWYKYLWAYFKFENRPAIQNIKNAFK